MLFMRALIAWYVLGFWGKLPPTSLPSGGSSMQLMDQFVATISRTSINYQEWADKQAVWKKINNSSEFVLRGMSKFQKNGNKVA